MIIRLARKDEVKKLQELNDKAFVDNPEYDADLVPGWGLSKQGEIYFTDLLNNPKDCCFVAEDKGKLVGYITAIPKIFESRKSKYIEIHNLGIIAEYRRRGIGKKLMDKCLTWAKNKEFQKVFLICFSNNNEALAFYKNYGFSEIYVSLEKDI
jgi:ribosomal protein S18 acetylase RimI-like enzyme